MKSTAAPKSRAERRAAPQPLPPSRRERQKADRRERIYAAAMNLFAQKGFNETTVQEITDAADVGKGTFFNYFPSKEAILLEYYESVASELIEWARQLSAPTAKEQIQAIFRRGAFQAQREGRLFEILIREIFARPAFTELDKKIHEKFLGLYLQLIERGKKTGEIRKEPDTLLVARLLGDIFSSTALEWVFYEKRFPMEEALLAKLDLLFTGLEAG